MVRNELLSNLDILGSEPWKEFFDKNLPGRDPAKDGKRLDHINDKKCMGAVGALCGKMGDGKTPAQGSDPNSNVSSSSPCYATYAQAKKIADSMKGACPCTNGKTDPVIWALAYKGNAPKYDKNGEADPATNPDPTGNRLAPPGSFDSRVVKPSEGGGGNRFIGGYPNQEGGVDPVDESEAEWDKRNKKAGYNNKQFCLTCPGNDK
jgi:hypothetical protein